MFCSVQNMAMAASVARTAFDLGYNIPLIHSTYTHEVNATTSSSCKCHT